MYYNGKYLTSEHPTGIYLTSVVISLVLSEMVPPMNSNESKRSGGVYASLGTRQERAEVLRTLA